jgi:hypothetical protein
MYNIRYRLCQDHLRASSVQFQGRVQRFCQKCSRFHTLDAFEGSRRTCRHQLAVQTHRRSLARKGGARKEVTAPSGDDDDVVEAGSATTSCGACDTQRVDFPAGDCGAETALEAAPTGVRVTTRSAHKLTLQAAQIALEAARADYSSDALAPMLDLSPLTTWHVHATLFEELAWP